MTAPSTLSPATELFTPRPAALADLPETVALFNTCSQELIGRDEFGLENVRNEWAEPGFNLATDTRIACLPDGQIVGYIEFWNSTPHVNSWIWARVHPDFRGQGIGTALMDWAEQRAQAALPKAPDGARVVMVSGSISTHQPSIELLTTRGFREVRRFFTMEIALDESPSAADWPTGIAVRAMRPGEERAIYAALDEAFKDHWGHVESPFEEGFARWQHYALNDPDCDTSLWFLAMDGDEIAGASLCWPTTTEDPDRGWISTLGVRRPWRRSGLGLALLRHSFAELYARGRRKAGLGVDATSLTGATRLYEKAGMRPIRQYINFEKELRGGASLSTQTIES
jgi:ribosomal protein S18 acetylase RimI-like enzyme